MSQQTNQMPGLDEAIGITVEYLRNVMTQPTGPRGNYGYDLWAPTVANAWALAACGTETLRRESAARRASPIFFEAAWELCRRGVLRPGIRETGAQAVSGGLGYSLTAQGREWLFSGSDSHFVMLQPGGLAAALAAFRARFGEGYHQRAQEAVRCRDGEAWYSACAMVGAAAESIVLAMAIAKAGNEATVLKGYGSANGQKKLLNDLAPVTKPYLARPLATVTGLLAYWRDDVSHGTALPISGPETEQALRELLQLAQFINENWDDLTLSPKAASAKAAAAEADAANAPKASAPASSSPAMPAKAPVGIVASAASTANGEAKTDNGAKPAAPSVSGSVATAAADMKLPVSSSLSTPTPAVNNAATATSVIASGTENIAVTPPVAPTPSVATPAARGTMVTPRAAIASSASFATSPMLPTAIPSSSPPQSGGSVPVAAKPPVDSQVSSKVAASADAVTAPPSGESKTAITLQAPQVIGQADASSATSTPTVGISVATPTELAGVPGTSSVSSALSAATPPVASDMSAAKLLPVAPKPVESAASAPKAISGLAAALGITRTGLPVVPDARAVSTPTLAPPSDTSSSTVAAVTSDPTAVATEMPSAASPVEPEAVSEPETPLAAAANSRRWW